MPRTRTREDDVNVFPKNVPCRFPETISCACNYRFKMLAQLSTAYELSDRKKNAHRSNPAKGYDRDISAERAMDKRSVKT